jgi:glycosyltransferase involved in cell wall biosynthesis
MDSLKSSFTISEINKLSELFEEVYVFYFIADGDIKFPENVTTIKIENNLNFNKLKIFMYNFFLICEIFLKDTFSKHTSLSYFFNFRLRLSYLVKYLSYFKFISKYFNFNENDYLYSFFTYEFALIPSFIKKYNPKVNFISLTHGRDLYEYIEPKTNKLSYRNFIFSNSDKVLSVSKNGTDYLKNRYPEFSYKFKIYHLGTKNITNKLEKSKSSNEIVIVSCSHIRKVKSVHEIPNLLISLNKFTDFKIKWVHFGSLPKNNYNLFYKELKKIDNYQNISCNLNGRTPQKLIFDFYDSQFVDFFLSVSKSEGLPVSMIEAASFGIPIISTDVGGCREIIKNKNLLLKSDFSVKDFISCYEYLNKNSKEIKYLNLKNWKDNFSFEKSKKSLLEILKNELK